MPAERFPAIELVPKRETQLLDFLSSNEESDGRGIVIAVLDQGKNGSSQIFFRKVYAARTMQSSELSKLIRLEIKLPVLTRTLIRFCDSVTLRKTVI